MMFYLSNVIKPVLPVDLIAVIQFMQHLHKHKGPLFVYKKRECVNVYNDQEQSHLTKENKPKKQHKVKTVGYYYTINPCLDYESLVRSLELPFCIDTALIRYHPYLHLFYQCRDIFNGLWPTKTGVCNANGAFIKDSAVNTIAICEWLRIQMKFPPLAAKVRAFEQSTLKQAKEVKTYFSGFFREDTLFYWHSIRIGFAGEITTEEDLTRKLTEITVFRTKLLSQLKNHDLITEKNTRYSWKIIVIGAQLYMHLQILHRQLHHEEDDIGNRTNNTINKKNELFIKQVEQSAETVKIAISPESSTIFSSSIDTKETKRVHFNTQLKNYFDSDFWFPYYQIACKDPKKMLFGKGNGKQSAPSNKNNA